MKNPPGVALCLLLAPCFQFPDSLLALLAESSELTTEGDFGSEHSMPMTAPPMKPAARSLRPDADNMPNGTRSVRPVK